MRFYARIQVGDFMYSLSRSRVQHQMIDFQRLRVPAVAASAKAKRLWRRPLTDLWETLPGRSIREGKEIVAVQAERRRLAVAESQHPRRQRDCGGPQTTSKHLATAVAASAKAKRLWREVLETV